MLGYDLNLSAGLNLLAVGLEIIAPPLEGMAGTVDGAEISPAVFQQQYLPGSKIVKKPAPAHDMMQFVVGQTFVKHRQVIAKVEERLHRVRL